MLTRDEKARRDKLQAYVRERPYAKARIQQGGYSHTGSLGLPNTNYEGTYATVRDARRGAGKQYAPVFDRHLTEDYPKLQIKVGDRYQDAREVLGL